MYILHNGSVNFNVGLLFLCINDWNLMAMNSWLLNVSLFWWENLCTELSCAYFAAKTSHPSRVDEADWCLTFTCKSNRFKDEWWLELSYANQMLIITQQNSCLFFFSLRKHWKMIVFVTLPLSCLHRNALPLGGCLLVTTFMGHPFHSLTETAETHCCICDGFLTVYIVR